MLSLLRGLLVLLVAPPPATNLFLAFANAAERSGGGGGPRVAAASSSSHLGLLGRKHRHGARSKALRGLKLTAKRGSHQVSGATANQERRPHIPGMSVSVWGNPGFNDSPLAVNPYAARPPFPFLDDMNPTAPMDRVDKPSEGGLLGSAPVTPGNSPRAVFPMLANDFVPEYNHPQDFPWEVETEEIDQAGEVPLDQRDGMNVVAKADRVRPYGRFVTSPNLNYPNIAPADRVGPVYRIVASEDRVPGKFGRYFEQLKGGENERQVAKSVRDIVVSTDKNKDKSINQEEYNEEVKGRQGKDDENAMKLWSRFQTRTGDAMTLEDFYRMATAGFDLGAKLPERSDVIGHDSIPGALGLGFWGRATGCPEGSFATGAALKVMKMDPNNAEVDNTALNAVKLICDDGSEVISTPEGPDGEWTETAECPDGQVIFGVSGRTKDFGVGMDNTAMNGVQFLCRSRDFTANSQLRFGTAPEGFQDSPLSPTVWAAGTVAEEGGWTPAFRCRGSSGGILCGIQPRLEIGRGEEDDMGVTDMRFFCCGTADRPSP